VWEFDKKVRIMKQKSSGIGEETQVVDSSKDAWAEDWSKDGRYIAYGLGTPTDLFVSPLFGERKSFPIVQSPFDQDEPHFSFVGKWIAYGSNESGTWQVYVVSFPAADPKRQISTSGADSRAEGRTGRDSITWLWMGR